MSVSAIGITGYRSIRKLWLPLDNLTVLLGANGAGKTNLYRSLELLSAAARGTLAEEIAREGGLGSIFWAGGRDLSPDGSRDPKYRSMGYRGGEKNRLRLEARVLLEKMAVTYSVEVGFPDAGYEAAFPGEAQIREESLSLSDTRRSKLMERKGRAVWARGVSGKLELVDDTILSSETGLSTMRGQNTEVIAVGEHLRNWRFFHGFRTDADSALRRPCRAITSPLLASDGSNLAAVFATLRHIRQETSELDRSIELAFPGAQLVVPIPGDFASFGMVFPEMPQRVFKAHEMSDGTLQYLALMGALLSYRLPPFIALNEPESSLHPSLLPALAGLIVKAAERSQIWVVTHSDPLTRSIEEVSGTEPRRVVRDDEGTAIAGFTPLGMREDE